MWTTRKTDLNIKGREYEVYTERYTRFLDKYTVYEIHENGSFTFIGKCISNDMHAAINEIIK